MKILAKIMYGLFAILTLSIVALLILPSTPYAGKIDVKIVKSGSMEPQIKTGGIVIIRESVSYIQNDKITFTNTDSDIPTTHRIIGTEAVNGETLFVTKGDANEERDTNLVPVDAILGKVLFTVPYLGFVLDFARQPLGFALLIGLPAFLIVLDELEKIWKEIRRRRVEKKAQAKPNALVVPTFVPPPASKKARMIDINRPVSLLETRIAQNVKQIPIMERTATGVRARMPQSWVLAPCVVLAFSAFMVGVGSFGGTISYFSDIERALANELSAGALGFTVSLDNDTRTFTDGVLDGDGVVTTLTPESDSVDLSYSFVTQIVDGNPALCHSIVATVADPFNYSGSLATLAATNVAFSNPWMLDLALTASTSYAEGDSCVAHMVYTGWNADLAEGSGGYGDTETVELTLTVTPSLLAPFTASLSTFASFDEVLPEDEGDTGSSTNEEGATTTPEETDTEDDNATSTDGEGDSDDSEEETVDGEASEESSDTEEETQSDETDVGGEEESTEEEEQSTEDGENDTDPV